MTGSRAQVATMMLAVAFGAGIVLFAVLGPSTGPIAGVAGAVLGALLLVIIVRSIRQARRNRRRRLAMIRDLQRSYELGHQASPKRDVLSAFGPLPGIARRGRIIDLFTGRLDGRRLRFFQHEYVISTGQSTTKVIHTIFTTEAPPWPTVTVAPRGAFGRVLRRLGFQRGLELESNAFNETFRITTDDEDFALTLLNPEMQSMLIANPRITWRINSGVVAMIYRGRMRLDRVERSLHRLREFWRLAPPELEMW